MHRVTVTDQHYEMLRQYMVATKLPHVRAAVERMIEIAAVEAAKEGNGSLRGEDNGGNSRKRNSGPGKVPSASRKG